MGKWQVSTELHEREIRNRDGSSGHVWLRELSEGDSRRKTQKMISYGGRAKRGDSQSARVDIGKAQEFEMLQSIVRWDFEGDDGETLPVDGMTLSLLPEYVTKQIRDHISELNDLPEDDEDDFDEDGNRDVGSGQNPTSVDSVKPSGGLYDFPAREPEPEEPEVTESPVSTV